MKNVLKILHTAVLATGTTVVPAFAEEVVFGVPNWPSGAITSNILRMAVEENLGIDVELQTGANPVIFEAMDKGSMHLHPEVYLPNQQHLLDKYRDGVVVTENRVPAWSGICVPKYVMEMGVTSVSDLTNPDVSAMFDSDGDGKGEIWIGAQGWASTTIENIRANSYGYAETFELIEMDEGPANQSLDKAIAEQKPWIFSQCSLPNYHVDYYDLAILKEPEHNPENWSITFPSQDENWLKLSKANTSWPPVGFQIVYAKELQVSHPQVASFLDNVAFTQEEKSKMILDAVIGKLPPEEVARKWVDDNQERILEWMGN